LKHALHVSNTTDIPITDILVKTSSIKTCCP